ncbi:MAG: DEAD/DEAH box helicase, partial [Rubrivivax sp.]
MASARTPPGAAAAAPDGARLAGWMHARGWAPHPFQHEVWAAMAQGRSGLLHATTGSGKTLAVWLGALPRQRPAPGLQVLWITPMRALAS